jgi:peptidyl-prolyl cis-trans isomerase C
MALTRLPVSYALGAFALALMLSMPIKMALAEDSDPVVARANGVDIHESDLALAEEEIGNNIPNIPPEQKRDYFINYVTDVVVLSQAAGKQGLADRPDVKRRLDFDHNRLLMESLLQETGRAALSDEAEHKV